MLQVDAVNRMLNYIGEIRLAAGTDLATLDDGSDGQVALQALNDITKDVLQVGWWFNTDPWSFVPDTDGYIAIPPNFYKVKHDTEDYIIRDHKLYDRDNTSYLFETSVDVTATVSLPFDDIPEEAATYITMRAAKDLSLRTLGMTDMYSVLAREEQQALVEFYKVNVEFNQTNLVDAWGITDPTTSA